MTTFVEAIARRAVSNRWCPEADTRDSIVARRNALAGLWAGRLMQLPEETLSIYAAEVHACDALAQGDREVVQKLWYDLNRSGVPMTEQLIRTKLDELEGRAAGQLALID